MEVNLSWNVYYNHVLEILCAFSAAVDMKSNQE